MTEEKRLVATIVPKIDEAALSQSVTSAFQKAFESGINVSVELTSPSSTATTTTDTTASLSQTIQTLNQTSTTLSDQIGTLNDQLKSIEQKGGFYDTAAEAGDIQTQQKAAGGEAKEILATEEEEDKAKGDRTSRYLSQISSASGKLADTGVSILKNTFGVIEDIYQRVKAASPLLQTIESLFNLAMTLFFMPLGNKLAEVLLPAVLELVDGVVEMWEAFDGMSLTEMVEYMMEYGVSLFSGFFQDIGGLLEDQGGILGTIGSLISWVGDFLENSAYDVLSGLLNVMEWILDNIKTVISLIVAFYAMQYASNIAMMVVQASNSGWGAWLGIGAVATAGAVAGLGTYGGLTALGLAEGGYVPAREGGTPAIIGEGGEGEYVIPESKMEGMGTTYNYFQFYGLTNDELVSTIDDRISRQISGSRIRGSF